MSGRVAGSVEPPDWAFPNDVGAMFGAGAGLRLVPRDEEEWVEHEERVRAEQAARERERLRVIRRALDEVRGAAGYLALLRHRERQGADVEPDQIVAALDREQQAITHLWRLLGLDATDPNLRTDW